MTTKPTPTLEWLHVCDYAFRDEQGKLCMIGLFDTLASLRLPGRLPVFCVAMGLTDGLGQYDIWIATYNRSRVRNTRLYVTELR